MARTIAIDETTPELLKRSHVDGNVIKLPSGKLDPPVYREVDKVIKAMGGKWDNKAGGHVFDEDPSDLFESVVITGTVSKEKTNVFDFFPTPPELACHVAELADVHFDHTLLEPSAGDGALIRAVRDYVREHYEKPYIGMDVVVEIDEKKAKTFLKDIAFGIVGDFTTTDALLQVKNLVSLRGGFDRIVMNPPFSVQQDTKHVLLAWQLLKPGGRLVAIMGGGSPFRQTRLGNEFRQLAAMHGRILPNPPGSFKASGTMVNTVTVVLNKPESYTSIPALPTLPK